MGLIDKSQRKSAGSKRQWKLSEDMFLIDNCNDMSNKEMAEKLQTHSEGSVTYRVRKLSANVVKLGDKIINSVEDLAEYHKARGTADTEL